MPKVISYKFDFFIMHVANVSDHSYNIANRNNQFNGMRFRALQGISSSYKPNCHTVWTAVVRGRG